MTTYPHSDIIARVFDKHRTETARTRLFRNFPAARQEFLLARAGLAADELPIVSHFEDEGTWCLISSRRLILGVTIRGAGSSPQVTVDWTHGTRSPSTEPAPAVPAWADERRRAAGAARSLVPCLVSFCLRVVLPRPLANHGAM